MEIAHILSVLVVSEESGEQSGAHTSSSKEHARYLLALVDMSFGAMTAAGLSHAGQPSSTASDSMYDERDRMSTSMNTSTVISAGMEPEGTGRRSNHALSVSTAFQFNGGKTRCMSTTHTHTHTHQRDYI
ncbi:unnamed protein product [Echinostoma caproni]|uniref:Secreted protein n=1 Tax=Echinostoma caproni TaxID=27848 RepID=A0A183BAF9_9TREM|nr:unnamed protein product [Echinostoma caproni]